MKLRELERHLRTHGCVLFREGVRTRSGSTLPIGRSPVCRDTVKSKNERPVAFVGSLKSRSCRHFDLEFVNPRSYLRCYAWLLCHDFGWAFDLHNMRRTSGA